jgi:hypothetical protein
VNGTDASCLQLLLKSCDELSEGAILAEWNYDKTP